MDESKFNKLINKIFTTEEDEISCSVCFDLVSEYVDTELAGREIQGVLRQVKHHLAQCKACLDEYELLRDFVKTGPDMKDASLEDLPE